MKRGLNFLGLFAIIVLIETIIFVSADFSVSPSSFAGTLGQNSAFNITITNPSTDNNITQVDITLPSGLKFISGTSSTNALGDFSNTSSILTWLNATYLIGNATGSNSNLFSFIANATSIGTSNISVNVTNSSGTFQKNILLNISAATDTTAPVVTLIAPANNAEDTDGTLVFECNATDETQLSSVGLYVWDSNKTLFYQNLVGVNGSYKSNDTNWDYTFNTAGTYKWDCFANDSSGNSYWATNRTLIISLSTPSCTANWTFTNWSTCADGLQTRTVTDRNNCNVTTGKPATNQTCEVECIPKWTCTGWQPVECPQNQTQTRICTDSENCNVATDKPDETRATCEYKKSSLGWIVLGSIAFLIIGGIVAALVFFFKSKSETDVLYPAAAAAGGGDVQTYQGDGSGYNYEHS